MTFKNAAADLPLGGGKAVIIGDPATRTEAQLRAALVDSGAKVQQQARDLGVTALGGNL